jgi:hypothetical protein
MKYDTDNCTWLAVPYARKDLAKSLGARFDGLTKRWYVPAHVSLIPFQQHGLLGQSTPERKRASGSNGESTAAAGGTKRTAG